MAKLLAIWHHYLLQAVVPIVVYFTTCAETREEYLFHIQEYGGVNVMDCLFLMLRLHICFVQTRLFVITVNAVNTTVM